MRKKTIISASDNIILNLKVLAEEKEGVRLKLVVTAAKLAATAEKLAAIAKKKEGVRLKLVVTAAKLAATAEKLAITAKKREGIRRRKLAVTAAKLAATAEKLAVTAKEKEGVRHRLAVTAAKLAATAEKLAITAKEKENVRRKLTVIASELAAAAKEKESVRRKLVVTAKEKEIVRLKLVVTAEKLKRSYEMLERKVFERTKDLEMARAKEEAILLSIGDGLLVTDEKGNVIIINKTAEKLFSKNSKEVVGRVFSDVIFLEDEKGASIPSEKHPVNVALATSAATATGPTYYCVREDKTKFPMAIMATPVVLNGKVIGAIKIFRDITNEREIDKAKTEFVSLASHQLRTPLSAVNWYTEMLLAGDVGELNEKQKKYLDEVYRSNQRMVELVNALLDVSSLELGTFVMEPESTDIIKLAQSVIDEQKPQIHAKRIHFSFLSKRKVSPMQVDPKLLRMVLQNILSNAVKYTPGGGKIRLSISLVDKKNILLKVSDTGYGIPNNQQDKIFTKLFRADNVRDKDTDGTGLGLYIAKSIVENAGGKIWFTSSGEVAGVRASRMAGGEENNGTTFYVSLPLDAAQRESTK
ncbi:MAG: ATP-binding protein [Patescibacteria group bacterium]|nr:ATP-binding protein [Patescibacteria group bacterium]